MDVFFAFFFIAALLLGIDWFDAKYGVESRKRKQPK